MQCNIIQSREKLHSAVEREIQATLSTVQEWKLKDVETPECEASADERKRRAVDLPLKVLFSLVVNSSGDDVEEKSEAVLFQMQYAVATGQFQISLSGMKSTANKSSLQHLFTNVTCAAGFLMSGDRKGCGRHCLI